MTTHTIVLSIHLGRTGANMEDILAALEKIAGINGVENVAEFTHSPGRPYSAIVKVTIPAEGDV